MTTLRSDFLWGAATAPHQIEGNNVNSDWWEREAKIPGMELSGDALDSYHRYREDMQLLAEAGLNTYRFGIEWARIEPRPGNFSRAELAHYRRMIDTALEFGLTPVITLNHSSVPRWFAEAGSWLGAGATERFRAYVERATSILDGVEWVVTLNEPNMTAMMMTMIDAAQTGRMSTWNSPTTQGKESSVLDLMAAIGAPSTSFATPLIEAHHAAREVLQERTGAKVGWTIANQALTATPGNEHKLAEMSHAWEDVYLQASTGDDFVGVQAYSTQQVDENGVVPHPPHPDNTLTGAAYRPDALGIAVRHAWEVTGGVPILVTENGIATADDQRRIAYTSAALRHLFDAVDDGIDVCGYLHWSALDNYEWGHWEPTFGLIAVDRETFEREPKPSLAWLGRVAQTGRL